NGKLHARAIRSSHRSRCRRDQQTRGRSGDSPGAAMNKHANRVLDDRCRLRSLVDKFATEGEIEVVLEPLELAEVAARLDGNPKAVLFSAVGAEKAKLVG